MPAPSTTAPSRAACKMLPLPSLLLLVAALTACGSDPGPAAPDLPPPNVLLISIDTLRADHLDAYGYARETAPNLTRLAEQGALFERCVAVSNWTLPTHTTLFTGLHPIVHGVEESKDALDPGRATLGEAFAEAGYETAGWFNNPFVDAKFGFMRGFERYEMALTREQMKAQMELKGTPKGAITNSHQPQPGPRQKDYFVEQGAEATSDRALQFLEERDPARPFLLFLHYNDVHSDYIPPAPFDRKFNPGYEGTITAEGYPHNKRVHRRMPPEDLAQIKALYDGEIAYTDQEIGRVLTRLDELGLARDTIVLVTSDHGEGFFEHNGKEHHYGLYDELVNIPFIVSYPAAVPPGQRITHGVSQADIAPTLLELARLDGLPEADGLSWAGELTGRSGGTRPRPMLSRAILKPILDEDGDVVLSLRTDELTVIKHVSPEGAEKVLVFDRATDPGEQRPLPADHPARAEGLELLELVNERFEHRRESLDWSADHTDLPTDPELLEQMRQWGYIK